MLKLGGVVVSSLSTRASRLVAKLPFAIHMKFTVAMVLVENDVFDVECVAHKLISISKASRAHMRKHFAGW